MPELLPVIGIIDSGTRAAQDGRVRARRSFPLVSGRVRVLDDGAPDELGHGSVIADILASRTPMVELAAARVFFSRLTASPAQVAAALDWLVEQGVRLVNMSFGLTMDRKVLGTACRRALDAGVILVAAAPARGDPVYPSAYDGVIRATGDARCAPGEISHLDSMQADFGGHVYSAGTIAGASIGCAHVSAVLAGLLGETNEPDPVLLMKRLIREASYRGPERRSG